jgi:uncharacterized protein (DUF4415 family)
MATKSSALSPREKRIAASELFTKPLTSKQRRELEALACRPDSALDYSDAPALGKRPGPVTVGKFYRPIKKLISMRIDADVLDWFRSQGGRYQTRINTVLRREMDSAHRH